MKHAAFAALLVFLVPLHAEALDRDEILGLVAMPLAVAAVSDVTGVPAGDLAHLVATLNRAQVPPTQFVQVVRYAPIALVDVDQEPRFVQYVDREVERGVVGNQLVTVIEERYRTYDVEPEFVTLTEPATTYVVREDYIPQTVVTRVSQVQPAFVVNDTNDLLALVAMPLAVAAVSEIADVPFGDLSNFVATLNAARVPPLQIVEVLRYSPVVLANDYERPRFVQFVRSEFSDGVVGTRLVDVIGDRLRTYDVAPQFGVVEAAEITVVDRDFFPPVVTSRVATARAHPHGGPPGQLKKELGLQTGAEVVHGTKPGRVATERVIRTDRDDRPARVTKRKPAKERAVVREQRAPKAPKVKVRTERVERPRVERQRVDTPKPQGGKRTVGGGHGKPSHAGGGGGGAAHGQGKGKGKGKG